MSRLGEIAERLRQISADLGAEETSDERAAALAAEAVESHREELDETIARHARGWKLERIAPLERNVMRVALYEIEHSEDVPDEVAIDEAVEIAKEYCGADAPGFVNGILGAIVRERQGGAVT